MATRKQKVKVALFLCATGALLVAGFVVVAGFYREPGVHYWCRFDESVLGLYEGGMVVYQGVPVGKVSGIRVTADGMAEVDMAIDPSKVTLNRGVEAQIAIYSLAAGTMAVSLSGGSADLGPLPPKSEIPVRPALIAAISGQVEDIMVSMNDILDRLSLGLDGIGEGDFARVLANVDSLLDGGNDLVTQLTGTVEDVREDVKQVTKRMVDISSDVQELTNEVTKLVRTTTGKIEPLEIEATHRELQRVLANFGELSERLSGAVAQFDSISANMMHEAGNVEYSLRRAVEDMRQTFESVQMLSEDLRANPSALIRGRGRIEE